MPSSRHFLRSLIFSSTSLEGLFLSCLATLTPLPPASPRPFQARIPSKTAPPPPRPPLQPSLLPSPSFSSLGPSRLRVPPPMSSPSLLLFTHRTFSGRTPVKHPSLQGRLLKSSRGTSSIGHSSQAKPPSPIASSTALGCGHALVAPSQVLDMSLSIS